VVKASDGNEYKVTGEMVNIQMEKLKITGMYNKHAPLIPHYDFYNGTVCT
jgi:hypothetical protein